MDAHGRDNAKNKSNRKKGGSDGRGKQAGYLEAEQVRDRRAKDGKDQKGTRDEAFVAAPRPSPVHPRAARRMKSSLQNRGGGV